jgi:hypothetical protein
MLASIINNVATYDVRIEFPIKYSIDFDPPPAAGGVFENLTVSPDDPGVIVATGQIQRLVPEPSSILLSLLGAVLATFLVRRM